MTIDRSFKLSWLGHAAFDLETAGGAHVLIDPWLRNPLCPDALRTPARVDAILLTHGHADHVGDAVALTLGHQPEVVACFELCLWMESKGATRTRAMNKGGTQAVAGVDITMVHADHSSGMKEGEHVAYCGEAVGYVVTLENGFRIYHAGDTNVFLDMQLIRKLYAPDMACLPIGGLFTMAPHEAVEAIRMLAPRYVVPMHYGTSPRLTGTPEELMRLLGDNPACEVLAIRPGETIR